MSVIKKLPPAAFVLVLICFFLPFVTFSCQGQKVMSLSGIQLVTGGNAPQPQMFGPPQGQRVNPEPLAVLGLLCALVGLGVSFLKSKAGSTATAILASCGLIFLLGLKYKLDSNVMKQSDGAIQVSFETGYHLSLLFLLAALVAAAIATGRKQ